MRVSVCMATHNGAAFIREQIDSILGQLHDGDELVISDDNSTDETLGIIHSFNNNQIRLLSGRKFGSPAKNFEYALTQCGGEIIFLADQDDIWRDQKIIVMCKTLKDCDLVVCDCRIADEKLNTIAPSFFERNRSKKGLVKNFYKSSFVGCCMAFNRKVLVKSLPFPSGISMHDQWIGLIAQKYFTVKFIPQILVDYRRHGRNYSSTGEGSKNSFGKKVISRVKLAKHLLQR
ncbi:alpha-L-Rha alpha-1,3-L-rhamnosyltransferase [Cytophagales bacterium WSM2-2]|nr:alpha-L-Rha alpha-1,3-L-rhamnosyltransferase [Cytophagales bacterium WSM2-2]